MRPLPFVLLLRIALLVAIGASTILIVEYQNAGDPAFCGVGSGCFAVRISPYSRLFGVPLPFLGLFAHIGLLAGFLLTRTRIALRAFALLAAAGAASAAALLIIQHVYVGAFCKWCVAVDGASIVAALCALVLVWLDRKHELASPPVPASSPTLDLILPSRRENFAVLIAAALTVVLPFIWGRYPVVPPLTDRLAALSVPGKVSIIGFTDFQCPFCRKLHPELHALLERHKDQIHYERRMMPLAGHPGALPAAQAYLCTPEALRERAADFLYAAPDEALNPSGVLALAQSLKLDPARFTQCLTSPETEATLAADKDLYQNSGARGLPLTIIGRRVVIGFDPDRIEQALTREISGETTSLKLEWLLGLFALLIAGTTAVSLLERRPGAPTPS